MASTCLRFLEHGGMPLVRHRQGAEIGVTLHHGLERLGAQKIRIGAPQHEGRDLPKGDELRPEIRHRAAQIDGAERPGELPIIGPGRPALALVEHVLGNLLPLRVAEGGEGALIHLAQDHHGVRPGLRHRHAPDIIDDAR